MRVTVRAEAPRSTRGRSRSPQPTATCSCDARRGSAHERVNRQVRDCLSARQCHGGQIAGQLRGSSGTQGSGNIGATNALRTQGKKFALLVSGDRRRKGVFSAAALPLVPWPFSAAFAQRETLAYACGAAAALGHCYPILHGFRGGKGVATLAGVYATVMTAALPWICWRSSVSSSSPAT